MARTKRVEHDTAEGANAALAATAKNIRLVEKVNVVKLPALPRAAQDRPDFPCLCGCGMTTKTKPGDGKGFAPGHNGRPSGWLARIERGVIKITEVPDGERQVVQALIVAKK